VNESARRDVVANIVFEWYMLCVNIISPFGPFNPFCSVCVPKNVKNTMSLIIGMSHDTKDPVCGLLYTVTVVATDEDTEAHELFVGELELIQDECEVDLVNEFVVDNFPHDSCGSIGDSVSVGGVDGRHDSLFLKCCSGTFGL
jgi:hypothetical protein